MKSRTKINLVVSYADCVQGDGTYSDGVWVDRSSADKEPAVVGYLQMAANSRRATKFLHEMWLANYTWRGPFSEGRQECETYLWDYTEQWEEYQIFYDCVGLSCKFTLMISTKDRRDWYFFFARLYRIEESTSREGTWFRSTSRQLFRNQGTMLPYDAFPVAIVCLCFRAPARLFQKSQEWMLTTIGALLLSLSSSDTMSILHFPIVPKSQNIWICNHGQL